MLPTKRMMQYSQIPRVPEERRDGDFLIPWHGVFVVAAHHSGEAVTQTFCELFIEFLSVQ